MSIRKLTALAAVPVLAVSLAACGESDDTTSATDGAAETSVAEEVATESAPGTVTESTSPGADGGTDDQIVAAQHDLPREVSDYTGEAKSDMGEESVTPDEVERVLAAANNKEAGVDIEWDDDGYWEISFGGIDIDVDPYGLVLEVDRDD
ncbi:hypothetical protein [Corynebacterium urinipleomorphum]|uniref:hypothetical protein n=1 Tax=Corynebacterium urinipleomorphum TaxID=1852380 RepID=UPI000B3582E5|nr:hypothetical protein [Corynebacterium urinipleomorphum]